MRTKTTRTTYYNDKSKVSVNILKLVAMAIMILAPVTCLYYVTKLWITSPIVEVVSWLILIPSILVSLVGFNGGVER